MRSLLGSTVAAALVLASVAPAAAQGVQRVKVGTLSCDVSPGVGMVIGSRKQMTCLFTPTEPGRREVYMGTITKLGLDLGATGPGQMVWAVYAPTTAINGALAGQYGGVSAEATVGLGGGVNVLVGGSDRTIALQPVSLEGQTGLNLAAGVSGLELYPAR